MKNLLRFFCCVGITIMLSSYTPPQQSDYGQWRTSSCYKGIDYAVKRGDYNQYAKKYQWFVKLRNRYKQEISIGYNVVESSVNSATEKYRTYIGSGAVNEIMVLLADANSVKVLVAKLYFTSDQTKEIPCDGYREIQIDP